MKMIKMLAPLKQDLHQQWVALIRMVMAFLINRMLALISQDLLPCKVALIKTAMA